MYDAIDFSNTGIELMEEGEYPATVSKAELTKAKNGNPMIKIEFTFTDNYEGRKGFDNLSLLPKSLWATKRALLHMGADKDALSGRLTQEELRNMLSEIIGNDVTVKVTIKQRSDNGEDSNEFEAVKSNSVFGF